VRRAATDSFLSAQNAREKLSTASARNGGNTQHEGLHGLAPSVGPKSSDATIHTTASGGSKTPSLLLDKYSSWSAQTLDLGKSVIRQW
jgi:hypothetical protein